MKRLTQNQIMYDLIEGLNAYHSWDGWEFRQFKVKGMRHVIRGDNSAKDLHVVMAVPMVLIQEAKHTLGAYDYKIYRPIQKLMDDARKGTIKQ